MINKFIFWFYSIFGKKDLCQNYLGDGNFEENRGWWFLDK